MAYTGSKGVIDKKEWETVGTEGIKLYSNMQYHFKNYAGSSAQIFYIKKKKKNP
jgi:hypothetical protein